MHKIVDNIIINKNSIKQELINNGNSLIELFQNTIHFSNRQVAFLMNLEFIKLLEMSNK